MAEDKTTLREAENTVEIEGLLLEIESRSGEVGTDKEYLSATLTIATNEDRTEQHQVEMFASKYKKDGTENGVFNSLQTVVEEYKSVDKHGLEEADYVRINRGRLQKNDYVGGDGQLRSNPQISTPFVNRVDAGEEVDLHAKFEVELIVDRVIEEFGKDEEETGRAILHGFIPLYGGRVIPFEFVVHEDGAEYVLDNYEKGDTVFVYGDIINRREEKTTKIESAFGEDRVKKTTSYIREFLIRGGTEPYDEDDPKAFDPEVVRKALAEREAYLEELVEKNKNKDKKKKSGFDTTQKKSKKRAIEEDELPF